MRLGRKVFFSNRPFLVSTFLVRIFLVSSVFFFKSKKYLDPKLTKSLQSPPVTLNLVLPLVIIFILGQVQKLLGLNVQTLSLI